MYREEFKKHFYHFGDNVSIAQDVDFTIPN